MVLAYHTIGADLCMENDSHLPRPRLVIIGSTGVGKSSLANSLMGKHPVDDREIIRNLTGFKDGCFSSPWHSGNVKTIYTCYDQGPFLGKLPRNLARPTYPDVTVVDTPDSEMQIESRRTRQSKGLLRC